MRFNAECTLVDLVASQDAEGNTIYERVETEAYCNKYSMSMSSLMTARSAGLRADAEIALRAIDYNEQEIVVFEDKEYNVEGIKESGEIVRLVLARRTTNRPPRPTEPTEPEPVEGGNEEQNNIS